MLYKYLLASILARFYVNVGVTWSPPPPPLSNVTHGAISQWENSRGGEGIRRKRRCCWKRVENGRRAGGVALLHGGHRGRRTVRDLKCRFQDIRVWIQNRGIEMKQQKVGAQKITFCTSFVFSFFSRVFLSACNKVTPELLALHLGA